MSLLANTAFAQTFSKVTQNPGVSTLVTKIMNVIVIPLVEALFAVTILVFLWGLLKVITKGDDPSARSEGQKHVLWGVIGMAIMISVYGIIRLIASSIGVSDPFL